MKDDNSVFKMMIFVFELMDFVLMNLKIFH